MRGTRPPWDPRKMRQSGDSPRDPWTGPFVHLCLLYFLAFTAGYPLFPMVPLHLRDLGAGLAESGRFVGALTLGCALGALATGPLGDRLGHRRVLRASTLLMAAFLAAYALLPWRWGFLLLAPLHGLVWSGLRTASVALAGQFLPEAQRGRGMSIFGMAAPGGIALGPALAFALLPLLGFRALGFGLALAFLGLHLWASRLPEEAPRPHAKLGLPGREALVPGLALFLVGTSFGPLQPFAVQEAKHLGLSHPSALLSALALGMVGLRLALGVVGLGQKPLRLLAPMALATVAGMLLMAFLPGTWIRHLLSGMIYGAGFGMLHTLLFMAVLEAAPLDRRGAGVGALYFSYDAGQALGTVALGALMEAVGARFGLPIGFRAGWLAAALLLGSAALLVRRVAREQP